MCVGAVRWSHGGRSLAVLTCSSLCVFLRPSPNPSRSKGLPHRNSTVVSPVCSPCMHQRCSLLAPAVSSRFWRAAALRFAPSPRRLTLLNRSRQTSFESGASTLDALVVAAVVSADAVAMLWLFAPAVSSRPRRAALIRYNIPSPDASEPSISCTSRTSRTRTRVLCSATTIATLMIMWSPRPCHPKVVLTPGLGLESHETETQAHIAPLPLVRGLGSARLGVCPSPPKHQ